MIKLKFTGLLFILTAVIIMSASPLLGVSAETQNSSWTDTGNYATSFASGSGTENDPYIIENAAQLSLLSKSITTYKTKCFKIADGVNTIDLSAHEWVPIGISDGTRFSGLFDGNGATITGLYIGTSSVPASRQYAGLFGYIGLGATVEDISIADTAIYISNSTGDSCIGGVAGINLGGTINGCTVSGTVSAVTETNSLNIGGITGRNCYVYVSSTGIGYSGIVINCQNEAAVTGISTSGIMYSGGVVGNQYNNNSSYSAATINSCNIGEISGHTASSSIAVGGVVGYIPSWSVKTKIINCYNTGNISTTSATNYIGSIAGSISTNSVISSYWLTGTASSAVGSGTATTNEMGASSMQASDFIDTLNQNATVYNGEPLNALAREWLYQANGYPKPGTTVILGNVLTVSVDSPREGTAEAYILDNSNNYVNLPPNHIVEAGTEVKIIVHPTEGYAFERVVVGSEEYTQLTDDYVIFQMPDNAITVSVFFKIDSYYSADPIYVNPNASVNGNGTLDSPYNSIMAAKEAVADLLITYPTANVSVYLMGGIYRLNETLVFNSDDSSFGTVTYQNYDEETPVITSGLQVSGSLFSQVPGTSYYSLQLGDDRKISGEYPEFRDLIVNGKRATLARSKDLIFTRSYKNQVIASNGYSISSCDNGIYVDSTALAGITSSSVEPMELCMNVEWKSQRYHISTIGNTENGLMEISVNENEWAAFSNWDTTKRDLIGKTYWFENHLSLLDEPGEFYYDNENGVIYYYPYSNENMNSAIIEYPVLDKLIEMDEASNITFKGINFTGTTSNFVTENGLIAQLGNTYATGLYKTQNIPCAAIYADYSNNISVLDCAFKELGTSGVLFNYKAENINITGNSFTNLAMSAIVLGVQELSWGDGASKNINLSNNYIENIGTDYRCAPAISVARADTLSITHNTLKHLPYSGITTGWGFSIPSTSSTTNLINTEIAYNYVEEYVYCLNDGAAIYTCGGNGLTTETELINSIHDNNIKAIANLGAYTGIYHDGGASNWHTYNNVVDGVFSGMSPIFNQDNVAAQYTHNITVENNYTTISPVSTSATSDRNIQLINNTCVASRDDLPSAAQQIIGAAGLEAAYQNIILADATEVNIVSNTPHFTITSENVAVVTIEITNNTGSEKTYNVSILGSLPANVMYITSPSCVTVPAGQTQSISVTFDFVDGNSITESTRISIGFRVSDDTGRHFDYPKAVSLKTLNLENKKIIKETPAIDGILDDSYLQSVKVDFGTIFYPNTSAFSDLNGYCYLLWDENYLYCYAVVNESTVMSRGKEWIENTWLTTHPWDNDAIETYIATWSKASGSKVAVDAFGVNCYGHFTKDLLAGLPYATAFTYNGVVIENYSIANPTAGQLASTAAQPVNGYVVEMTIPIAQAVGVYNGVPEEGDIIQFKVQNNDFKGYVNDTPYIVALTNQLESYLLSGTAENIVCNTNY